MNSCLYVLINLYIVLVNWTVDETIHIEEIIKQIQCIHSHKFTAMANTLYLSDIDQYHPLSISYDPWKYHPV